MPTHGCDILDPRLTTVVVPILPPLLSKQGVSDNAVFLLFASKSLVQIVCNPAVGALIDRRVLCFLRPASSPNRSDCWLHAGKTTRDPPGGSRKPCVFSPSRLRFTRFKSWLKSLRGFGWMRERVLPRPLRCVSAEILFKSTRGALASTPSAPFKNSLCSLAFSLPHVPVPPLHCHRQAWPAAACSVVAQRAGGPSLYSLLLFNSPGLASRPSAFN